MPPVYIKHQLCLYEGRSTSQISATGGFIGELQLRSKRSGGMQWSGRSLGQSGKLCGDIHFKKGQLSVEG